MGTNIGNGLGPGQGGGGIEMPGMMQANPSNQPHATEYTLQGVMRFLQTEWHRHERDRNAWEIEKQEMKSRIGNLEGAARRSDATQKALKKYVTILEKKVKEQASQLKASGKEDADAAAKPPKADRVALIEERLRGPSEKGPGSSLESEGIELERIVDEDSSRFDMRSFLDQCQSEFTYLMVTPANPIPPRESPPLPILDELPREGESFGLPGQHQQGFEQQQQQQHPQQPQQQQEPYHPQPRQTSTQVRGLKPLHGAGNGGQATNHLAMQQQQQQQQNSAASGASFARSTEMQPSPMVRSNAEMQPLFGSVNSATTEWPTSGSAGANRLAEEGFSEANHQQPKATPGKGSPPDEAAQRRLSEGDGGWDFNETTFADAAQHTPQQPHHPPVSSNRPDTDVFPTAENIPRSPNRGPGQSHRRKSSMSRRRSAEHELSLSALAQQKAESGSFKLRFGLRGHLNTVRTVIFSGGGSPGEPEICTAGDDGLIKRFHIPRVPHTTSGGGAPGASDLDVQADFTHRGHQGAVLSLASWSPSPNFSTGGRAQGDGWIFSGGQDSMIRVWERGRVDPKASLDGHTDAVWALCVLPATLGAVFGSSNPYGSPDRILLASGAADGTVRVWAVSAPPQMTSPQPPPVSGSGRRGAGGSGRVRGNSMSSGSAFPSSPQPSVASNSPFNHTLVHCIRRTPNSSSSSDNETKDEDAPAASPTCIAALGSGGEAFVVSYSDAAVIVYDTRTGEEMGSMASLETYDGTPATSVNAVVATTVGLVDQPHPHPQGSPGEDEPGSGPTGGGRAASGSGVEGVVISGHEDQYVRFFDANSGQNTYNMLAHPASISSLSLSPNGQELVSAGHDASLRFWSLEKRTCTQEITSHRIMRGEGVCAVVWSQDGKWVVSGGGDGVVKVFTR